MAGLKSAPRVRAGPPESGYFGFSPARKGLTVVDSAQLQVLRVREYPAEIREHFVNADLSALLDINGDRRIEPVVSIFTETQIDDDPCFCPARIGHPRIVVLDDSLRECGGIQLGSAPYATAVARFGAREPPSLLVLTDRLERYEPH